MAYISYNKLWDSAIDKIASKQDKLQDMNINQLKLEEHDSYEKDEKITTDFEPINIEHVINKANLDKKYQKKRTLILIGKWLQPNHITVQQTVCRRNFISESCENEYKNTL